MSKNNSFNKCIFLILVKEKKKKISKLIIHISYRKNNDKHMLFSVCLSNEGTSYINYVDNFKEHIY